MKKAFLGTRALPILIGVCISMSGIRAADCPIIFVHGQQGAKDGKAKPKEAWKDWNPKDKPYKSAMQKILEEGYGGYTAGMRSDGKPLNCHKNSSLTPTGGETRKIYNFSYYNPDGSPGVIGSNGNLVPVKDEWREEYEESASHACWAKHLADFIDKVLEATGAEKVDIVAHSMGGLVARAAIKWYGCEGKVRKLLTIGTPNQGWHGVGDSHWMQARMGHADWQIYGEDLEMNIDPEDWDVSVLFKDQNGNKKLWAKFLGKPEDVKVSTIAGDYDPGCLPFNPKEMMGL